MKKITLKAIAQYKKHLTDSEKSPSTVEKYTRDIRKFWEYVKGREIDKGVVLEYKASLIGKYAPRSINSIISALNSLFDYLGRHDCKVKLLKIQRQIFADRERELTKREYERLLKAAERSKNHRLYYLMQTVCATGIRISEDIYCKG